MNALVGGEFRHLRYRVKGRGGSFYRRAMQAGVTGHGRAIDLPVRRFIIVEMKRIAWTARYRFIRRVAVFSRPLVVVLIVAGGSLMGMASSVQAQLVSKQIPAYIPKLTTHASPFTAYAVAFLGTVGVTIATFRSAHRGTRAGGREK